MQVRIGIVQSPREIDLELPDDEDAEALMNRITQAVGGSQGDGDGDGAAGMLWLTDKRGRHIGVASSKVAYVEVGTESGDRRVGFSAL